MMFVTVYVDLETYRTLVTERLSFDACLYSEGMTTIQVLVPIESTYQHPDEEDMVIVKNK